jgi:hypothetical protein
MGQRLARGESVVPMYRPLGLVWLQRQVEIAEEFTRGAVRRPRIRRVGGRIDTWGTAGQRRRWGGNGSHHCGYGLLQGLMLQEPNHQPAAPRAWSLRRSRSWVRAVRRLPARLGGLRMLLDRQLAQAGLDRHTALEVNDVPTLLELIAHGLGIALVPEVVTRHPAAVRYLPLRPPAPTFDVAVATVGDPPGRPCRPSPAHHARPGRPRLTLRVRLPVRSSRPRGPDVPLGTCRRRTRWRPKGRSSSRDPLPTAIWRTSLTPTHDRQLVARRSGCGHHRTRRVQRRFTDA